MKLNSLQHLSNRVSMYVHAYTLYGSVRPFGVSCLIGSYDAAVGPQMYCIDPSGVSFVSLVIILLKCSLKYRCKFYNWFSSCALTIFSNSGSFRIWHKFDLMVFCFIRVKPWYLYSNNLMYEKVFFVKWFVFMLMCRPYIYVLFQGYYGCAIGKAKQAAKTEIEKIKVKLLGNLSIFIIHAIDYKIWFR